MILAPQAFLAMLRLVSVEGLAMTGVEKLLAQEGADKTTAAQARAVAEKLTEAGRECSRQVVEHWVAAGYVPGKWAPLVNSIYRIPLHELNPSIYPKSAA